MQIHIRRVSVLAALCLVGSSVQAQQVADPGFKSVGRGWPLAADLRNYEIVGPSLRNIFNAPPNIPIPLDPSELARQGRGTNGAGAAPQRPAPTTSPAGGGGGGAPGPAGN